VRNTELFIRELPREGLNAASFAVAEASTEILKNVSLYGALGPTRGLAADLGVGLLDNTGYLDSILNEPGGGSTGPEGSVSEVGMFLGNLFVNVAPNYLPAKYKLVGDLLDYTDVVENTLLQPLGEQVSAAFGKRDEVLSQAKAAETDAEWVLANLYELKESSKLAGQE
jgi:hypothetical protein